MTDMLRAAQWYARRGLAVFPLREREKITLPGSHGCHDATTDERTIARMWRNPQLNVGIECGRSGVFVVDVDGKLGALSLAALERQHGRLPITPEVITANGRHIWFKAAPGVRNSVSKLGEQIDTRGPGGYVLVPPSVHPSGHVYRWAVERGIHQVELAPLPQWIVDAFKEPERNTQPIDLRTAYESRQRYGFAALRAEVEAVRSAPEGTRNHRLNAAAFSCGQLVAAGLLDGRLALGMLIQAGIDAGLREREVLKTCNSGLSAGERQPRQLQERAHG